MKASRLLMWLPTWALCSLGTEAVAQAPATATTASPWPDRLLWAGLGLVLGVLVGYRWQASKSRRRHQHHSSSTETAGTASTLTAAVNSTAEFRAHQDAQRWKQRHEELQQANAELSQRNEELAAQLAKQQGLSEPEVVEVAEEAVPVPPAPLEPVAAAETTPPEPVPPLPAATRYGPVQETPFVEERKIVDAPLPQLALMLTVSPHNPDQASFTLNPQVNQTMLIGDGLNRLQKFFDYDPPLGGRISAVAAAAPGTLQRRADGWQVVERARLLIS